MKRKRNRLGAAGIAHKLALDRALNDVYQAIEDSERAATCRRRADAMGRAYREWGHVTANRLGIAVGENQRPDDVNEASEALIEARIAFEKACLREKGTRRGKH